MREKLSLRLRNWGLDFSILSRISYSNIFFWGSKIIAHWVEAESVIKWLLFFKSELLKLIFSDLPFYDFSFYLFTIGTMAEIFNIRWLKWTSRILIELFFNWMDTSQSRFIMLSFDNSWLVFFVHTLNSLTSITLKILIARFYWVFYVDNLLLSEIFKIHIFGAINFFLILINFDFHLIDKTDSYGV